MSNAMLQTEKTIRPDFGLEKDALEGITESLAKALGSVFTLGVKTKKYHWNLTGPHFQQLHELFDEQYGKLQAMTDDIAEYIRQFGAMSPGTLQEFKELSTIDETIGYNPEAFEMVADLVTDYESLVRLFRQEAGKMIDDYNDIQTEDLYIGFMHKLTKQSWFLRAHLENFPHSEE